MQLAGLQLQSPFRHKCKPWSLPAAPLSQLWCGASTPAMGDAAELPYRYLSGVWADSGCLLADRDPAGGGEGSPAGPGDGHAAGQSGATGRGECTPVVQRLSQGLSWSPSATGSSWFGLPRILSHCAGGSLLLAADHAWLLVTPALCSSPGQLLVQAGPSCPRHRAPVCHPMGQTVLLPLQVLSPGDLQSGQSLVLPHRGFSQPTPPPTHGTPSAHPHWVLCAHGRENRDQPDLWDLCRGLSSTRQLCPPTGGSWKPD